MSQKETYNGPTCVLIMVNLGFIDALHEMRVVVQQHYENKWYGLGWAAIALGMVIGLLAAVYLIYYLFITAISFLVISESDILYGIDRMWTEYN